MSSSSCRGHDPLKSNSIDVLSMYAPGVRAPKLTMDSDDVPTKALVPAQLRPGSNLSRTSLPNANALALARQALAEQAASEDDRRGSRGPSDEIDTNVAAIRHSYCVHRFSPL